MNDRGVVVFGLLVLAYAMAGAAACGGGGTQADRLGVGAQCAIDGDCQDEPDAGQRCLLQFKGGYCGIQACTGDATCPAGSACVLHSDGINYCFRICIDKPECNRHRALDNEANCSSNVTFVDGANNRKACVPPSGS